jgi:hypothetical protein
MATDFLGIKSSTYTKPKAMKIPTIKKVKTAKPSKVYEPKTPIAKEPQVPQTGGFFLPNLSGDHSAGNVRQTPINPTDLVNKEYVDSSIPANVSLFFTENSSDIGGVYLDMEVSPVTDTEESTLTAIPGSSAGTLMATFATLLADRVIGEIVELPVGVYGFHVHCEASSADKLSMYAEIYHRNAGGTETLLLTTEDSNLIPTTKGSITFHGSLLTEKEWVSTDRIVIKLYGKNNSAASRNLTIYVEGDTASRSELPAIRATPISTGFLKDYEADIGVGLQLTQDNSSADTQYTAQVLYNTDDTPPAAGGFPVGTIYIQYTN